MSSSTYQINHTNTEKAVRYFTYGSIGRDKSKINEYLSVLPATAALALVLVVVRRALRDGLSVLHLRYKARDQGHQ